MSSPAFKVPFDVPTWTAHLNADDPLALVIRGHLYIEAALIQQIESVLVNRQEFDSARLPFNAKVRLAVALGKVDAADCGAFTALNGLRRTFAHDVQTELSEQDELNLYNALSSRQRQIVDSLRKAEMRFLARLRLDIVGLILALLPVTSISDAAASAAKKTNLRG